MKTCLIAITPLVLVLTLPVALYAQETDPASVVRAAVDTFKAGETSTLRWPSSLTTRFTAS